MLFRLAAVFLCLFAFAPAPVFAQADDPAAIGTVISTEGSVLLARPGKGTFAAAADMPVYLNDAVETGNDSRAFITFVDDSQLTLGDNARLEIDEYVFDTGAANKGRFSVLRGAFLFASGLINKSSGADVKIDTGYGSIGLRGTTVWGGELDGEYGVFVEDGEVTFENARARSVVRKGEGTMVRGRNHMPSLAKTWGAEKIGRAKGRIALRNEQQVRAKLADRLQKNKALREKRQGMIRERIQSLPPEQKERMQERRDTLQEQMKEGRLRDAPRREPSDGSAPSRERQERNYIKNRVQRRSR